jgi:hypothetical protein
MMDIEAEVLRRRAAEHADQEEQGLKQLFVSPAGDDLPNDGTLNYVTLASVYDFKSYKEGDVVVVADEFVPELKCVVDNSGLFAVVLRVLTGVPNASANTDFDHATWKLEKVAYAPFISELSLQREVAQQEKLATESRHDRERRQFTRADGTVKAQTKFDLAGPEPVVGGDEKLDDEDA